MFCSRGGYRNIANITMGLTRRTTRGRFVDRHDAVLIGGSGDYSVTRESGWLDASLDLMRDLVREAKPTFASCWGFQAMAKAHAGKVETDLSRAEVGTHQLHLTEAGKKIRFFVTWESNSAGKWAMRIVLFGYRKKRFCSRLQTLWSTKHIAWGIDRSGARNFIRN